MGGKKLTKVSTAPARSTFGSASRGRTHAGGASFPVAPPRSKLPIGYAEMLGEIKLRIQQERLRVVLTANAAMVLLYWDIGRMILDRQERAGWGSQGDRPAGGGLAPGIPRHEGLLPTQSQVHARVCRSVAGAANCARGSCTNSLVSPHRVAGEARRSRRSALVRPAGDGARLVAQHHGAADRWPRPRAPGQGHLQLPRHAAARRVRPGRAGLYELAFYDALEVNDSAVKVLGEPTLAGIARELVATVKKNVTIDWTMRENVRAQLRVIVKRILRKYGYPPDKQEKATQLVLEQAEVLSGEWALA